jgi:hypothetical protein
MPFVYRDVDTLQSKPLVGNGECVTLVKEKAPQLKGCPSSMWKQGASVMESPDLARGTAIATFVDGKYPNKPSGNHAAFFLKHAGAGIWVMDQWKTNPKRGVAKRRIPSRGKNADGSFRDPSNNADAFSVIEIN